MSNYTIQSGDTLSGIASRFGLNWKDLANWNNIADPNKIYAGNTIRLGAPNAVLPAAPAAPANSGYQAPTPTKITPFSEILNMQKIFPDTIINKLAEEQLAPDIMRQQQEETSSLNRNLAASGTYRTGQAPYAQQKIIDAYSRALKEQKAQFGNQIQDWLNNWYTQQYTNYYTNPSAYVMPTLPTFDEYLAKNPTILSAYNSYIK